MKSLRSALVLVAALAATSAHAQLSFTLLTPAQTTAHSTTVSYQGTLTNIGLTTLDLTGSSFTIVGAPAGLTLDDSPLYTNFPLTFGVGDSFTAEVFTVAVADSATISAGTYTGDFTVQTTAGDVTQGWQVTVTAPPALTPEMPAVAQLLPGLLPLALLRRRRKNTAV